MVAKANVCSEAGFQLAEAWRGLDERDATRACAVYNRANRKLHRGAYATVAQVKAEFDPFLKRAKDPKAGSVWVDLVLDFIEGLIDQFKNKRTKRTKSTKSKKTA